VLLHERRSKLIEFLTQTTDTCLGVQFSGKVTGAEYQKFLDAVNEHLKAGRKLSLVLVLADFEFYGDFAAAQKDMQFGLGEYKHIHRAAFVGDQKWIKWFTNLIGPFTRAEERQFTEGQLAEACSWAST
jgi:hypothetical protein